MRRMFPIAAAASALTLALPGVASAHHRSHHHRSHHARRARVRTFGAFSPAAAPAAPSAPAAPPAPTPPTTPTPPTPAGTVLSFTEGVLTITLPDKSTVSGKVTEDTELECTSTSGEQDDQGQGDDEHRGEARIADHADGGEGGAQGDDGEEGPGQDDGEEVAPCTTESLKPGATVLAAELSLTSGGSVWERIELAA